jgi:hypothetical protein
VRPNQARLVKNQAAPAHTHLVGELLVAQESLQRERRLHLHRQGEVFSSRSEPQMKLIET